MRRTPLALLLVVVLALVGSACGGDDGPEAGATSTTGGSSTTTTTTAVAKNPDDLVASIAATLSASVQSLTDEQARCLAQAVADQVGPDADGDLNRLPPAVQDAFVAALTAASDACGVPLTGASPG